MELLRHGIPADWQQQRRISWGNRPNRPCFGSVCNTDLTGSGHCRSSTTSARKKAFRLS